MGGYPEVSRQILNVTPASLQGEAEGDGLPEGASPVTVNASTARESRLPPVARRGSPASPADTGTGAELS